MGYRSEVALALSKEAYNNMPENVKNAFNEIGWKNPNSENENSVIFYNDWIKWYESDNEINLIENFISNLEDKHFGFIRLGEDNEDIEFKGKYFDFGISFVRKIEF
jgi:hypothetical protein